MKAATGKGFEPDICRIKVRKIINYGQLDSEMYLLLKMTCMQLEIYLISFHSYSILQETPLLGFIVHPSLHYS